MNAEDQFEAIVNKHYEALYRFAMSLTRAESDAMDLTQQTFYVWAEKGHQLRDIAKVKSWLYTTLHRAFLQSRRRTTRFSPVEVEDLSDEFLAFSIDFASQVDSSEVLLALSRVSNIFQPALALFYLEDYSYAQIAAILDLPLGTVKSRIARGVVELREIFLSREASSLVDIA